MKKVISGLAALFFSILLFAQTSPKGLNVNDKAPEFSAKDQNGKMVSLL